MEANLNRKANGLALEGPSVGLYVPLLEFNHHRELRRQAKEGLDQLVAAVEFLLDPCRS